MFLPYKSLFCSTFLTLAAYFTKNVSFVWMLLCMALSVLESVEISLLGKVSTVAYNYVTHRKRTCTYYVYIKLIYIAICYVYCKQKINFWSWDHFACDGLMMKKYFEVVKNSTISNNLQTICKQKTNCLDIWTHLFAKQISFKPLS